MRHALAVLVVLALATSCKSSKSKFSDNAAKGPAPTTATATSPAAPGSFTWLTDETKAFAQARASGKGVVIQFAASWSTPDVELEAALADPKLVAAMAPHFVPLRIDVSDDNDTAAAIRDRYNAKTLPFVRFLETDGTVLMTITTLLAKDDLKKLIDTAIQHRKPPVPTAPAAH